MSVFSMAHLKVDASVEFSGNQSVGHDHHQPWDCKQHEQQQDVPEGDATPTVCINRKKHFNSIKIRHVNVQLIIRNSKTAYQSYQMCNPYTSAVERFIIEPDSIENFK